MLTPEIFFI